MEDGIVTAKRPTVLMSRVALILVPTMSPAALSNVTFPMKRDIAKRRVIAATIDVTMDAGISPI